MKRVVSITGVTVVDCTAELPRASRERTVFTEEALLIEAASRSVSQAEGWGVKPSALVIGVDGLIEVWQEAFFKRVLLEGPLGASPLEFPFTSPNALAARLSICLGIKGESLTVTSGVLSFLKALAYASELVSGGIAEAVLVGGVTTGKAITVLVASGRGEFLIEKSGEQGNAGEDLRGESLSSIEESFTAFTGALASTLASALGCTRPGAPSEERIFSFVDSSGSSVYFRFSGISS